MKKIGFLLLLCLTLSCNDASTMTNEEFITVTESAEYKNYVTAYNDYVSCVASRPQLTNDLLSKKIDNAQFEVLLEKNTTICALKRKLYLTHFDILLATFPDEEAAALQLDAKLEE